MGVGHVPEDPVHPEGEGAHLQGRQRRGTAPDRDLTPAHARGRFGEDEAARWYRRQGFEVLARNWRCPQGEIDLVLGRPGLVVFCEVKARATDYFGGGQAAVGRKKQQRLRRLAATWLAESRGDAGEGRAGVAPVEVRFDVAALVGARIEVIAGAF